MTRELNSAGEFFSQKERILFKEGASQVKVYLGDNQLELFGKYLTELMEWNQRINITAIRNKTEILIKHFLDSLTILTYLPDSGSIADIGSGGGFPGIPIKIARPALTTLLIESNRKKANFLRHVIRILPLSGIAVYHGRVETFPTQGIYDCVVSRALSDLGFFFKAGTPLMKPGGILIAMKGKDGEQEMMTAQEQMVKRELALLKKEIFSLPFDGGSRTILVFQRHVSRETLL